MIHSSSYSEWMCFKQKISHIFTNRFVSNMWTHQSFVYCKWSISVTFTLISIRSKPTNKAYFQCFLVLFWTLRFIFFFFFFFSIYFLFCFCICCVLLIFFDVFEQTIYCKWYSTYTLKLPSIFFIIILKLTMKRRWAFLLIITHKMHQISFTLFNVDFFVSLQFTFSLIIQLIEIFFFKYNVFFFVHCCHFSSLYFFVFMPYSLPFSSSKSLSNECSRYEACSMVWWISLQSALRKFLSTMCRYADYTKITHVLCDFFFCILPIADTDLHSSLVNVWPPLDR